MSQVIRIDIKPFDELTLRELHACLRLRAQVFVVGQQICCEADPDEWDPKCHHAMLWQSQALVGTARLLVTADPTTPIKVGRVAVAQAHRGKGLGRAMMLAIHDWIGQVPGRQGVMSAQAHLEPWYTAVGWEREGEPYIEADIKHVKMRYTPENAG